MNKQSFDWRPIEDLPPNWESTLASPQVAALARAWQEQSGELRNKELLDRFVTRLRRQWAIETGILEGLYTLSEGATRTLIEHGLDAALISHEDASESPDDVLDKIRDQHQAIEGLYQFISSQRSLGKSYIKELHAVLTAHQPSYIGRDTLGNRVVRELPRGEWKKLKNNVEWPGGHFEFCPPEHVEMEIERLLEMYNAHQALNIPPDVEAAWLHHRFSLIHPFTDGNGRVCRCLATLVLLKAGWFPLVVTRHDRREYISSLRAADEGNLAPLAILIGGLQRKAIREALSLGEDILHESTAIRSVLQNVRDKLERRRQERTEQLKQVIVIGDALQILADQRLHEAAKEINATLTAEDRKFKAFAYGAVRDSNKSSFHYFQVIQAARKLDYFANLTVYQAWTVLAIETGMRTEILFSFHGVGQAASGVLCCSPMAYRKETTDNGESVVAEITVLSDAPFEFTYADDPVDVESRFRKWLDGCLLAGLNYWQKIV